MDLDLEVKTIKSAPIFAGMDPCKMRLLACMSEQLTFETGEYLFRAGDLPDAAYIVLSGDVEFIAETAEGPTVIGSDSSGAIIGEVALLCDEKRFASARATSPLAVMRINKECLMRMMQDSPQFSISIARELAQRISQMAKREGGLLFH